MVTIDVNLEDLEGLAADIPVVVDVPEADVILASDRGVVEMRARSARIDLARRRDALAARAPRLLASLGAAS
ncbi:MAG: hypothetical protein HYX32_09970 [Actinobacteria bacterium]|nr:hypothetical protein [Actinomycetota bacterium]